MASQTANLDLDRIVGEVNPSSPTALVQASHILHYCGKKDDDLKSKLEACDTEISELQRRGHGSIRLINDAIHGPIELSPLMHKIINTPEFHRLKDVKQLGAANYVYPGANHTRFDHSIGVFYLAGEFARHLQRQAQEDFPSQLQSGTFTLFTDGEVICAQIAGLCHDLGHGPFSHLFQQYVMTLKHEDLSVSILKKLVSDNTNVLAEFVCSKEGLGLNEFKLIELMIQPPRAQKGEKLPEPWIKREFLCEIVANKSTGVDVDKWDYYARDCHYLGVTSDFQERRCMLLGRIVKVKDSDEYHIAFRDKELDNIYGMFRTRAILHQKAYQHKTIKAVERMIADAIIEIQDIPLIQVLEKRDPISIRTTLKQAKEGHVDDFLALTDSIVGIIKCCPVSLARPLTLELDKDAIEKAKEIVRRIETRDLYHCSTKIRIPKNFKLPNQSDSGAGSVASGSGKEGNGDTKFWEALMELSKDPNGVSIYKFLAKKGDEKEYLWVPILKIKLPSEKKDNPIDDILFYKKPKDGDNHIDVLEKTDVQEMTSLLVVPQAFIECEVRVYDKRGLKDRMKDDQEVHQDLRDALIKWKTNLMTINQATHV